MADFFGMVGELLTTDCGHRIGFELKQSELVRHNPDDAPVASIHTLECLTCGESWLFAQHRLPPLAADVASGDGAATWQGMWDGSPWARQGA